MKCVVERADSRCSMTMTMNAILLVEFMLLLESEKSWVRLKINLSPVQVELHICLGYIVGWDFLHLQRCLKTLRNCLAAVR